MPVPSTIADISTTASSNSPAGTDAIGTSLDDYLRAIQAILKQEDSSGVDIASASAITIPSAGKYFTITGTTAITSIVDSWTGRSVVVVFNGALTFTHSAGLILPGAANITTAAGDAATLVNESTGVWRCVAYQKAANTPGNATTFGGLTTAQIAVLGTASVQALNVSHFGSLTTAQVTTLVGAETLTNKRITPRVGETTSSATPTINTDSVDIYKLTAQAVDITSFTTNLSGTPTDGQVLIIQITGTAARAITWGTSFEASTVALPTTTVTTAMLTVGFIYNSVTSKWRCVASC